MTPQVQSEGSPRGRYVAMTPTGTVLSHTLQDTPAQCSAAFSRESDIPWQLAEDAGYCIVELMLPRACAVGAH